MSTIRFNSFYTRKDVFVCVCTMKSFGSIFSKVKRKRHFIVSVSKFIGRKNNKSIRFDGFRYKLLEKDGTFR